MKIVVLDGYTLNPGDLDWQALAALGDLVVHDRTPAGKVVERSSSATAILTNKVPVTAEMINALPSLKYIGVVATGYNIIDVAAANKRGIIVTNVPGYGTDSVVQLTFALLFELTLRVQRHSDAVMEGRWTRSADFSFHDFPLTEIAGKNIGIIGFGTIGRKVADAATVFGMNIIAQSRTRTDESHRVNFHWAEADELLAEADVVSLHCPLTPETNGLMNAATIGRMKKTAFLLNTSRGPLILEKDLANALNNEAIAGAALDVLSTEPPPEGNPLLTAKNCIITPHIAWATKEARARLMQSSVDNLIAFVKGAPVNVIRS